VLSRRSWQKQIDEQTSIPPCRVALKEASKRRINRPWQGYSGPVATSEAGGMTLHCARDVHAAQAAVGGERRRPTYGGRAGSCNRTFPAEVVHEAGADSQAAGAIDGSAVAVLVRRQVEGDPSNILVVESAGEPAPTAKAPMTLEAMALEDDFWPR
jgi:hypothetical protein